MSSPFPAQAASWMTGLMAYTRLSGNELGGVRRGEYGNSPCVLRFEFVMGLCCKVLVAGGAIGVSSVRV